MDDELKKDIADIKHTMVKIENDLKYHIKRTDLLEAFMKNQIKFLLAVIVAIVVGVLGKAYGSTEKVGHITAILGQIQKEVPCKIKVTSGYRSPKKNKAVGGARNSYHLYNRARDIQASCLSPEKLAQICKKYANGVIVYKHHVHIDNREKPYFGKGVY
jgi:hypothetical protein